MKLATWGSRTGAALLFALGVAMSASAQAPAKADATKAAPPAAAAAPAPAAEAAKAPPALAPNSTANIGWNKPPEWSKVETLPQYASVPGRETNVLVEDHGHKWRELRNGPVTSYGGYLLLIVPVLLILFYFIKGPFKLHGAPTGKLIERFNSLERMTHWTVAISFLVLAVSGIFILFGKYFLLPVIGASAFSALTVFGKTLHNFVGPLFMFSLVAMFFIYVKDNFMGGSDFAWLARMGGILSGKEMPSGRFNGGEKAWFWLGTVVLGTVVCVSGLILLFPNWNTGRELMASANIWHAVGAVLFMALSLGHIYMGLATEGAYKGMREGYVDETWAQEHHSEWYADVKSGKAAGDKDKGMAAQPAAGDD
ncbi:MAG: formate dehydrogenase subunit gamma [Betaproteobacteria bacterium]|nr:formate dehydrogenase subunit gamma [Betaproteobacteria bacterium]